MIELKQILHPTDFSANSNRALEYACSLAGCYGAELHLVHVLQDPGMHSPPVAGFLPEDYYEHLSKHANVELAALPDKISKFSGSVTRDICTGAPFVEIIKYAKENAIGPEAFDHRQRCGKRGPQGLLSGPDRASGEL
jgi:nucleotide-binding universal stress UspA family protein